MARAPSTRRCWRLRNSPGVTLCAPLDSLPFRSDSIDAIFLPHTLELVEDPYAVLREAERVLTGEGCLMICGFNPFSGWGVRRTFARYFGRPAFPPGTQRMLSERRLRDWVALLGFDVDYRARLHGVAAVERRPRGRVPAARAMASGAYLLKARKRVPTLTPVRPRRRVRQRVLVGAAEPTSKSAMTAVDIFTDGACRGNPGPGGWAALLIAGKDRREVCGAEAATTNNRMELMRRHWRFECTEAALRGEVVYRLEVCAARHYGMAAQLEGAGLAHRGARTCEESGLMGAAGRGGGNAGCRVALGQRAFRT